jgi:hypothetical protein
MSVIKVNKMESTGTTAGGVEVDSSGHVTVDGVQMPTAGALSSRNLVVNGAMQVAQRGTQYTGLYTGAYTCADRMYNSISNLGTWTIDQSTDAPAGFTKSHKITCTTADASPTGLDYAIFAHIFEAQNLQHLKYGTSAAESLTLSFWVKSNKTGGASIDMWQPDSTATGTRLFSKGYTINSANTWEYKTITIPGDTAGVIFDDNGSGLYLDWWLNSGPDYTGGSFQTTWGSLDHTTRNASNLGVGGAVNDYFQITGIQLEVGEKATPFEHRSYGDELARCKRYFVRKNATGYQRGFNGLGMGTVYTASTAFAYLNHDVEMRAAPTVGHKTISDFQTISASGSGAITDITISTSTEESTILNIASSSAFHTERMFILWSNTNGAYIDLNAEL